MKISKRLVIILFFLFIILANRNSYAQIGFRASLIEISGVEGYAVKPGVSYEFKYNNMELDSRYKLGISIGFFSLKPRQDTTYYLTYSSENIVYPSYQIIEKYNVTTFRVENGFKLFKTKISPLIGIENGFSITHIESEKDNKISSGNQIDDLLYLETMPKFELLFNSEHMEFIIGFSKCFTHSVSFKIANSYWKPYLVFSYYF